MLIRLREEKHDCSFHDLYGRQTAAFSDNNTQSISQPERARMYAFGVGIYVRKILRDLAFAAPLSTHD
jgi:hypothetical protein